MLFGSGETSPSGRKVFDRLLQQLRQPPHIALLETPAGFELNSAQVAGRVAEFMRKSLQNFAPSIQVIPARMRGTPFSPDEPAIVSPLLEADLIFLGPGSPTYAARQLRHSLAWHILVARHRLGAALALASAATIAISNCALPVYEIYKVGEDIHWKEGLNFFCLYGLDLVFIPHWNNREGGAELDTSHCFMGEARFNRLYDMLPGETTVVGLDENTALWIDFAQATCQVFGAGSVTLLHTAADRLWRNHSDRQTAAIHPPGAQPAINRRVYHNLESFPLAELGSYRAYQPEATLPTEVWQQALETHARLAANPTIEPPPEVLALVQQREAARQQKDWPASDALRSQISALGWQIKDSPDGPVLTLR